MQIIWQPQINPRGQYNVPISSLDHISAIEGEKMAESEAKQENATHLMHSNLTDL